MNEESFVDLKAKYLSSYVKRPVPYSDELKKKDIAKIIWQKQIWIAKNNIFKDWKDSFFKRIKLRFSLDLSNKALNAKNK